MLKGLLIIGLVATILYMVAVMTNVDRKLTLSIQTLPSLIEKYALMPLPTNRVVIILVCESGLCESTLKSLLNQSVRVSDIAIETDHPENITADMRRIVSLHPTGSTRWRESEADTIVFILQNGEIFDYDYIESRIADPKGNASK
jgi:hypothetical protein